jgi:hypothetical protein
MPAGQQGVAGWWKGVEVESYVMQELCALGFEAGCRPEAGAALAIAVCECKRDSSRRDPNVVTHRHLRSQSAAGTSKTDPLRSGSP